MPNFFSPQATESPSQFVLEAQPAHCVFFKQGNFLMGGVSFAACIDALEHTTQKPLINASAQFLSRARVGDKLAIHIETLAQGKNIVQARATLLCGERAIMQASAALGRYETEQQKQFIAAPKLPPNEDLRLVTTELGGGTWQENELRGQFMQYKHEDSTREDIHQRRVRFANKTEPLSSGMLAVIADFFAGGHPETAGSSSLDNTIRIIDARPHEMCEEIIFQTQFSAFRHGLAHGRMALFHPDGALLALASQSIRLPLN